MRPEDVQSNPHGVLFTLRIIWLALLLGPLIFLFVVLSLGEDRPTNPETARLLFYLSGGLLLLELPVAFVLRSVIYGPDRPVPPGRYFTGNVIFLSMIEGAALFGGVSAMFSPELWPNLAVPVVALAINALNFPTGAAMDAAGAPRMRDGG